MPVETESDTVAAQFADIPPDLVEVVKAWLGLSDEARGAFLGIVRQDIQRQSGNG